MNEGFPPYYPDPLHHIHVEGQIIPLYVREGDSLLLNSLLKVFHLQMPDWIIAQSYNLLVFSILLAQIYLILLLP